MSKRKRKKIITSIISSVTLIGGVTAGIIYSGKTEKEEESEEQKTKKIQTRTKLNVKPIPIIYNKYTVLIQQLTIFLDEDNNKVKTDKIDLSNENIKKIVQIGFYQNGEGEMQVVKMPKIIEEVPDQLPSAITSTKRCLLVLYYLIKIYHNGILLMSQICILCLLVHYLIKIYQNEM